MISGELLKKYEYQAMTREEIRVLLEKIEITPMELKRIKDDIYIASEFRNYDKNKMESFIEVYKLRFLLKCPIPDIARYFGISRQQMNNKMKEIEWNYTRIEAGMLASKKRNYREIRLKSRQTFLDDNKVYFGSSKEEYIRQKLNILLPKALPNEEIVVGLNNMSILSSGREVDIPVIIIREERILKYCIEPGNPFHHKDNNIQTKRDKEKRNESNLKNYRYIEFIFEKMSYGYIDKKIHEIINTIKSDIEMIDKIM